MKKSLLRYEIRRPGVIELCPECPQGLLSGRNSPRSQITLLVVYEGVYSVIREVVRFVKKKKKNPRRRAMQELQIGKDDYCLRKHNKIE